MKSAIEEYKKSVEYNSTILNAFCNGMRQGRKDAVSEIIDDLETCLRSCIKYGMKDDATIIKSILMNVREKYET